MNFIKCEKLEKSMAELQFSIDAEAFKAAVADVFKKEGKKYPVQGFRKGKAPKALIEKMYGADVFTYDAINELFPAAYEEAVKAAGIEPVGRPEVSVDSASEAEGAALTVKVAVKPEVKIGAYNGLTVEKTVHTVSDEAVEAELKRVQERNARELTREGAAENGDIVDIDFEGFVDGVAFEGGKAEHYSLTLGSGSFIPGFEDQIVGHAAGEEFDVNVTFPDGYSDSTDASGNAVKLSGQKAVFTVTLNYISESVLPELTDSWVASTLGTSNNIYTVEALRAYYQDQLYTSNLNTAVMDDLLENSTFKSIPQQVMDYQVNQCLNYYSTLAGYYGYDLDGLVQNLLGYENTDAMLAHLESNLEDYAKEALLYQAVAESLDIAPTQEQLDAYSDYKDTYGQNYCTMVALMDAVTSTLTSGAVVS